MTIFFLLELETLLIYITCPTFSLSTFSTIQIQSKQSPLLNLSYLAVNTVRKGIFIVLLLYSFHNVKWYVIVLNNYSLRNFLVYDVNALS